MILQSLRKKKKKTDLYVFLEEELQGIANEMQRQAGEQRAL